MLAPSLITPPTETPVDIDEAKAHLRVEYSDEDVLITSLIEAATAHLDGWTGILGRALITQTWRQDFCAWPGDSKLRLPLGPILPAATMAVKYRDASNVEQTVSTGDYALLSDARGPYLRLGDSFSRPALRDDREDRISVTFEAGYGAPATVPAAIRSAILLIVGDLYKNRDAGEPKPNAAVDMLLTPYRRVWCG